MPSSKGSSWKWLTMLVMLVVLILISQNAREATKTATLQTVQTSQVSASTSQPKAGAGRPQTALDEWWLLYRQQVRVKSEEWWRLYRQYGQEPACEAVAEWVGTGDLDNPESELGRAFNECMGERWPVYYFFNWFEPSDLHLFTPEELNEVERDVRARISSLEAEMSDPSGTPEAQGILRSLVEVEYQRLEELNALAIGRPGSDR